MSSYDLASRLEGTGVTINVLHPGGVQNDFFGNGLFAKLLKLILLTPEQGAQTSIYLATSRRTVAQRVVASKARPSAGNPTRKSLPLDPSRAGAGTPAR